MSNFAQTPLIEPLEARIAPATLLATHYTDKTVDPKTGNTLLQFINAAAAGLSASDQQIADSVGDNASVYFIHLGRGDDLKAQGNVGSIDLVNVSKGNVVAFFTDSANVGVVDVDELSGLALGGKVSVAVGADVHGDVVTNYNDTSKQIGAGSTADLLPNAVTSLTVAGNITGALVSGGNVSRFTGSGDLHQILTGTAADTYAFNFDAPAGGGSPHTLVVGTPGAKVAGPSLSNAVIGSTDNVAMGSGGPGASGGSIANVTVLNDTDGFVFQAGNGGAGSATVIAGGRGGSISTIVVNGALPNTVDLTPNSPFQFIAGAGGAGNTVGIRQGAGGAGGLLQHIFFDYNSPNANDPAPTALQDNVFMQGGAGGAGKSGGAGGGLMDVHILASTPHDLSLGAIEFQLLGGAGGDATTGKAGAGGAITGLQFQNAASPVPPVTPPDPRGTSFPDDSLPTSPTLTQAVITAGDGGHVSGGTGIGGAGGGVSGLSLKGFNFQITGGTGQDGPSRGGAGGSIANVNVIGSIGNLPGDNIHAESLGLHAGDGGNSANGRGGAGGGVSGVAVSNSDFALPDSVTLIGGLQVSTGNGGDSTRGPGAAAGSITNFQVLDTSFDTILHPFGNTGLVTMSTGQGGTGTTAGGGGGSMSNVSIVGDRLNVGSIQTGAGGDGGTNALKGRGGAAGGMANVAIHTSVALFDSSVQLTQLLLDTTDAFAGVIPGDIVTDTTTGGVATVLSVDTADHELVLSSQIFSPADAYSVAHASAPGTAIATGTGSYFNSKIGGLLLDSTKDFSSVHAGDTITNTTTSDTSTVLGVDNVNHELILADRIFATGDAYQVDALTGTAQNSGNTLVDATTNFIASGVLPGDAAQDVTNSIPTLAVAADVTSVTAHVLTLNRDVTADFAGGDDYAIHSHGSLATSVGGNGNINGAGGAGGSQNNTSIVVEGGVLMSAGGGGDGGATGAAGAGGSFAGAGAFSTFSLASITAGSAGTAGSKAGAGGGISGANLQALSDIMIVAGDGHFGGKGGSISNTGFSGPDTSTTYTPTGANVLVQAGAGGDAVAGVGGAGGGIATVTGFVSNSTYDSAVAHTNVYQAGLGGSGTVRAGTGGTINGVRLFGGGAANVTMYFDAGDAGDATSARVGAAGGSVTGVAVGAEANGADPSFTLDPGTIFHHLSAGNGGDTGLATGRGGVGGSVTNVHVNGAIGLRTGADFGYDLAGAGGISAGAGGAGGKSDGAAGNVTGITADAIASIVAGHLSVGDALTAANLASVVDGIILNDTNAPVLTAGTLNPVQFGTANLVGSIADITLPSPTTFHFTNNVGTAAFDFGDSPVDGLVAAVKLTTNKNFVPEAFVTADASGNAVFVDNVNS